MPITLMPLAHFAPYHNSPRATMSQSLAKILVHLTFSTKHRRPWIDKKIRPELNAVLATKFQDWESPALIVGSVDDHVHALFSLSRNHAIRKVVEEVKKESSKWIKTKGAKYRDFYWQAGYGAFSVSQSNVPRVRAYIANQEEHHQKRTFQDELRALLRRHQIEFDERYVWD
jgi:putative transposase